MMKSRALMQSERTSKQGIGAIGQDGQELVTKSSSYEHAFSESLGGVSSFAFWKGRVALYAILRALRIGPSDQVILPGFTCVVVPNAVRLVGATPVYADIEAGGYNIDAARAAELVGSRTRAILMQHSFGVPAPVDGLLDLARRHRLHLIEDCAHTFAGGPPGAQLGTLGAAAFFSSQWSKPYTTGLGGMAVTGDPQLAERLRRVRDESVEPPLIARLRLFVQYHAYLRLFTPRLSWRAQDALRFVARLGLFVGSSSEAELNGEMPMDHRWRMARAQQRWGEQMISTVAAGADHRRVLARHYDECMGAAGWPTPARSGETTLLRYPALVANKKTLLRAARRARIELGSWFDSPLHPIPLERHARFGYTIGQCPNAERAAEQVVNLPLHGRVTHEEADRIASFFLAHAESPAA